MKSIYLFLIVLLSASCTKYKTQYEGPTPLSEDVEESDVLHPILYSQYKVVTLTNSHFTNHRVLVNSGANIEDAVLNERRDRVAYKVEGENIKIIDTLGNFLGEVSNSKNIVSFEYYPNSTLYMCDKLGNIRFYGLAIHIRDTKLSNYITDLSEVQKILIMNENVFCIYKSQFGGNSVLNVSSKVATQSAHGFPSNIANVGFVRAYYHNISGEFYRLFFKAAVTNSGERMYEVSNYSGFGSYNILDNDIELIKPVGANLLTVSFDYQRYFRTNNGGVVQAWNMMPLTLNVRSIDF